MLLNFDVFSNRWQFFFLCASDTKPTLLTRHWLVIRCNNNLILFQYDFLTWRVLFNQCVCSVSPQGLYWLCFKVEFLFRFNAYQNIRQRFHRAYGIMFHGKVWLAWITLFLFLMFNSTPAQEVNLIRFFNCRKSLRLSLCKLRIASFLFFRYLESMVRVCS